MLGLFTGKGIPVSCQQTIWKSVLENAAVTNELFYNEGSGEAGQRAEAAEVNQRAASSAAGGQQ